MKNRIPAVLFACALAAGCSTPESDRPRYVPPSLEAEAPAVRPAGGPLRLDDCLHIALERSRLIRMSDRRILIARDNTAEAVASLLPKLSVGGRYEVRNNDPGAVFGAAPVVAGERKVFSAGASLIVPIYDFGVSLNRWEAMRIHEDRAGVDAAGERQRVTLEVTLAFFRVLEARRVREVVDESLKAVDRQVKVAKDARDQGLVAANDVLAAEVQQADRRQQRLQAENNEKLATAVLNRLLGERLEAPTALAEAEDAKEWHGSYPQALRAALENRTDLASLRKGIEEAQATWRATRDGLFPRIYAYADYRYTSDKFVLNNDWADAGIAIDLPLFDGGATLARIRRGEREIENAVDMHEEQADEAALSVMKAYLDLQEAAARIPVAQKAVELGEENLRVMRDLYEKGQVSSAEVLTEEDRLARARSAYFQSRYGLHEATARLAYETGGSLPNE